MVHLFLTSSKDEITPFQMAGLIYRRPDDLENKHGIVIVKTNNRKKFQKNKTCNDRLFAFFQEKLLPIDFASKLPKIQMSWAKIHDA